VALVDVAREAGITFVHESGATDDKLMVETFGSGVAWIDYDNDGFLDPLLRQRRGRWPSHTFAGQRPVSKRRPRAVHGRHRAGRRGRTRRLRHGRRRGRL
jgi:hypothetical protein